jgi:hypothetical protein
MKQLAYRLRDYVCGHLAIRDSWFALAALLVTVALVLATYSCF